MKCYSYNMFFETIGGATRLKILEMLQNKAMNVTEICDAIKEEQSNVSHNLKKLVECHFIDLEKKGKQRIYSLNKETILPLMQLVGKHVTKYCCKECPMKEVKK